MSRISCSVRGGAAACLLSSVVLVSSNAFAAILPPGNSAIVNNASPLENWGVSNGGTLTIDGGQALTISAQRANVVFNGGQSLRIDANTSALNLSRATVDSAAGRGAIQLIDSSATIDFSTITSTNSFGLLLGRNINTPASSSATVTGGSVITGAPGGANAVGFAVLKLENSTVRGTGATSYGVQLGGATLSSTGSTISGVQDGLQIITDNTGVNASTVTLNNTRVTGGTGSAIVLGSSGAAGAVANINVLGSTELIGGNGTLLQATNRSTANLTVDASALKGNVIVDTGSTVALSMQNAASIEGNLQNVTRVNLDSRSVLNGNVLAVAGTGATVNLNNGSTINGNVENVASLSLNNASSMTGDVNTDTGSSWVNLDSRSVLNGNVLAVAGTGATVNLNNGSAINGNVENVASLSLNNASSMTGDVNMDTGSSRVTLDTGSVLNGNVLAVAGTGATVDLNNRSAINGNVENVASLSLNNASSMTGDVSTDTNGSVLLDNSSVLTGQINNSGNLNINNAAQWVMTGDSNVQRLALNDGVVRMGTNEQFQQLNVGDLSGKGTFVMGSDLGNGDTDFLNVTGNASGQHQLQITATGTTPVTAEAVKVGNIAAGDASFSLGGRETVDAGTFVYRLAKEGQGLYLNPDKETVSTSSNTALALAGSARSVLNAEGAMLSDQLGDRSLSVRPEASMRSMNDSSVKNLSNSVWVRTYGNQYNVGNAYGDGYTQNQTGITGGADTTVDLGGRSWVLGGFVGTSHTKMDLKYDSSATVDSLNAGVYGSTFDVESGVFVNVMAKINQFDNKAKVTMSDGTRAKGDYKALGASGSVAVGKHIRLKDDYFVEPQVQVSTGVIQSESYKLDNGLEVKADTMRSFQGKVGVRGGRVITLDNGSLLEPSLSTAVNHEFVKTNEVKINDDSFDDDRASSSIEYGAGLKWTPAQRNWQVSGQVGGSKGTTVSQDWSGSLRLSYFF
ncbi:autotransporter outer membrane beta-barrel domain-containing protein [Pseudomonas sp. NPDC098740]|uniref:autotransporter outer membrane beta-barrel domain-containing protein n=1 Tax=Pseudomonas sp. NPDC098740 TaxID=3364486 RepID=UPI00383B1D43